MSKSLNDILNEMDSLKNLEDYEPGIMSTDRGEVIYDEMISLDMARSLLGNKFDSKCRYRLLTLSNSIVVSKINDMWPTGKPEIIDSNGHIIDGPIVEYELEVETKGEAQSYNDMLSDIEKNKNKPITTFYEENYDVEKKTRNWYMPYIGATILFFACWTALIIALILMKGGL